MKTDQLIHALAQDVAPTPKLERTLAGAYALAILLGGAAFLLLLAPRPDLGHAMHDARFLFKFLFAGGLAAAAATLAARLARPAAPASLALVAGPLAILAAAIVIELAVAPRGEWGARLVGQNWNACLAYIPLLSAGPFLALLAALRRAAPTRPGLAGAMAGLLAGATGAFFYAAHCPDDSPLFVAVWYTLAISAVSGAGALVGARWLRW